MEGFNIDIQKREGASSTVAKNLRKQGKIPVVVYSRGEDSVPATVAYNEFIRLAEQAKISQVFTFKSGDKALDGRSALVRDIQKDYLSGKVIHVDFQGLKEDEEISVTVPLHFMGEAFGVKTEGGALSVHAHELEVSCLPKDIPLFIEIDITNLKLNTHLHARDLQLPQGVGLVVSGDEPIVSVVVMKEEAPAAAEAAAAAPAADAGEAPAKK